MADEFYQYNPELVVANWFGIPIQGVAAGSFMRCEYDEDAVVKTVGGQGAVTATVNANRAGRFTFTLEQGSETNTLLAQYAASNRARGAALIAKPFLLRDLGGLTICEAAYAWILRVPPAEFGKEALGREWVLDIADLNLKLAGNIL